MKTKTLSVISFCMTLVVGLALFSCEVESELNNAPIVKAIDDIYKEHKIFYPQTNLLEGNILIRNTNNQEVVVIVNDKSKKLPFLYILQKDDLKGQSFNIDITKGRVLHTRDFTVIHDDKTGESYLLTIEESPNVLLEYDHIYVGYGISQYRNFDTSGITSGNTSSSNVESRLLFMSPILWGDLKPKCGCTSTFQSDSDCDSGGRGSDSCSVSSRGTGCSTSCDAGYACCKY